VDGRKSTHGKKPTPALSYIMYFEEREREREREKTRRKKGTNRTERRL
jgi:hypothetical protein